MVKKIYIYLPLYLNNYITFFIDSNILKRGTHTYFLKRKVFSVTTLYIFSNVGFVKAVLLGYLLLLPNFKCHPDIPLEFKRLYCTLWTKMETNSTTKKTNKRGIFFTTRIYKI